MGVIDDVLGELPALRQHAESLMLDAGSASRPTGGHAYNSGSQSEGQAATPLFSSPCKIQARNLVAREAEVGGRTATSVRLELHLPADTDPLQTGDLWTIDTAHELSLAVEDAVYRVLAPVDGTLKTARRYEVERS